MTFLPIVDRELRVAARKRNTFWLRVVAALIALVIGGGFMVLSLLPFGGMTPFGGRGQMGGPLFAVLTWLSLATALSAGLFFTSDCVSEEKREGTLGFLFLTDLRGYDVVLGKLLATSLRCVFGLVAIFPVLAITQLMGGVEATQFWKTLLALVNALFISLAGGLFVWGGPCCCCSCSCWAVRWPMERWPQSRNTLSGRSLPWRARPTFS